MNNLTFLKKYLADSAHFMSRLSIQTIAKHIFPWSHVKQIQDTVLLIREIPILLKSLLAFEQSIK